MRQPIPRRQIGESLLNAETIVEDDLNQTSEHHVYHQGDPRIDFDVHDSPPTRVADPSDDAEE